ncbi:MAG: fumarylpyruvate hydrolase [Sulfitobacter sp.]|jgi:fumarylpyruvate hydrolase
MTTYLFPPAPQPSLAIEGEDTSYPVHRIFCVGRNYVAHATEMGGEVDREAPWYFMKSAHALVLSGVTLPYPPGTSNFHHEMELVIALGAPAFQVSVDEAMDAVFGYAAGLDMTRRDLQQLGKDNRRPWDLGKDIEGGAVIGAVSRTQAMGAIGPQRIQLSVNGASRQDATLADMVWSVPEIIAHLSQFYHLQAGDLIMTGTPAGVGPVVAGDVIEGQIEGLAPVTHTLGAAE